MVTGFSNGQGLSKGQEVLRMKRALKWALGWSCRLSGSQGALWWTGVFQVVRGAPWWSGRLPGGLLGCLGLSDCQVVLWWSRDSQDQLGSPVKSWLFIGAVRVVRSSQTARGLLGDQVSSQVVRWFQWRAYRLSSGLSDVYRALRWLGVSFVFRGSLVLGGFLAHVVRFYLKWSVNRLSRGHL